MDDARGDFSHSEQDLKSKLERMMEDAQVINNRFKGLTLKGLGSGWGTNWRGGELGIWAEVGREEKRGE